MEFADEAVLIGEGPAKGSYVNAELILQVARETGADAIHPGYGFLPEPAWSKESRLSGQHLSISSCSALSIRPVPAEKAGVPMSPGTGLMKSLEEAIEHTGRIGYPVMLKSTAGGGGIGMRICADEGST